MHYTTIHYNILPSTELHYNSLQYTTKHCTTLQFTAIYYQALRYTTLHCIILTSTALHYNSLQYTTKNCTTLQLRAIYYQELHYTTMHCISLHCFGVVVYSSALRLLQSIALFLALKKAREKLGLEINRRNKLSQRLKTILENISQNFRLSNKCLRLVN